MDNNCKPITLKFDQEWVQVLINLRMKYSKLFTGRRNSATEGWKLIFEDLQQIGAPEHLTINKIKKKWMNLMTRYKQIKNNLSKSTHVTWPFYDQIDRAFGKNHNNNNNDKIAKDEMPPIKTEILMDNENAEYTTDEVREEATIMELLDEIQKKQNEERHLLIKLKGKLNAINT